MQQTTAHIMMVRPKNFGYNEQTASSNDYQLRPENDLKVREDAIREFDEFVHRLRQKGIVVQVIEDTETPIKPDAVFPNNWISLHADGTVVLYPMKNANRAAERRMDIVEELRKSYQIEKVLDLSKYESEGIALEGTGSIIFDHLHKKAYACVSPRTDAALFKDFCQQIGYSPVLFHSYKRNGAAQYHTNVVMCIGEGFCVICLDSITDAKERQAVEAALQSDGIEIIAISREQLEEHFAGNMLQLRNPSGEKYLVMSENAFRCLQAGQLQQLSRYTQILSVPIYTIEKVGGGSARCMMAEIFLPGLKSMPK